MNQLRVSGTISSLIRWTKVFGTWLDFGEGRLGWALKWFTIFRFVYQCVTTLSVIYQLLYLISLREIGFFALIGMQVTVKLALTIYNHRLHVRVLEFYSNTILPSRTEEELSVLITLLNKAKRVCKIWLTLTMFVVFIYILIPTFIDVYAALWQSRSRGYRLPMILAGFFNHDYNRRFTYYLLSALEFIWVWFAYPAHIATEVGILFSISLATSEIQVLKRHVLRVKSGPKLYPKDVLKNIIVRHQQLLHFVELVREHVALPMTAHNLLITLSLCFTMFTASKEKDQLFVIILFLISFLLFLWMTQTCLIGEYLESEGQALYDSIIEIDWFAMDVESRKYYNLLVMRAKNPVHLNYKRMGAINNKQLMKMVNSTYSYFMILKSTMN